MKLAVNIPLEVIASTNQSIIGRKDFFMSFISILFKEQTDSPKAQNAIPSPFFVDLNLVQVVDSITANWKEYNLNCFYNYPLTKIDAIAYRHEVFKDLENQNLCDRIINFSEQMREIRRLMELINKLYYDNQKKAWFLNAADIYCDAVKKLASDLSALELNSRAFGSFLEFINNYTTSKNFIALDEEIDEIKNELAGIKYRIIINGNTITVQNYEPGIDYSEEIEATFEKFKLGAVRDYLVNYNSKTEDMNHIEAQILDFVVLLNSSLFKRLSNFYNKYENPSTLNTGKKIEAGFIEDTITVFDREIHFYISYLKHIEKFKIKSLKFCYPHVTGSLKEVYDYEGFDLALAHKLLENNSEVVSNDFSLKGKERVIVVTGPNQGGKTTFARTFGQLHYIASLGCPVTGSKAQLFLFDQIFTQFEREEKVENQRGKLEDDLIRIHSILEQATSNSIIIMNEIFASTTIHDVIFLSKKIMEAVKKLDLLCVWVTFVDELAFYGQEIVSMTSMVEPENPAMRTFKVIKRSADGLAYALALAERYKLTYFSIKERIKK